MVTGTRVWSTGVDTSSEAVQLVRVTTVPRRRAKAKLNKAFSFKLIFFIIGLL